MILYLFFFFLLIAARGLGVATPPRVSVGSENNVNITTATSRRIHGEELKKEVDDEEELVTVDYTPPSKKPPIHN